MSATNVLPRPAGVNITGCLRTVQPDFELPPSKAVPHTEHITAAWKKATQTLRQRASVEAHLSTDQDAACTPQRERTEAIWPPPEGPEEAGA